ncbi:MAG TPA: O-methyltransferase [Acidimicrobiia bacterium]|jgi:caffeoyl-CoA O-methyltransferase|nr:O-methyltransferase [Acidimicrobiia bacterium]
MADAPVAPKSFLLTADLAGYLVEHGSPPDDVQVALIEETRELGAVSGMQIAPEQGAFLTILTRLVGARSAVEVGTFTGYSSLCIARGLGEHGRLVCCDVSEEWTAIARRAWARAGVADRIDLRIAPGADTLRAMPADETIDLAFIDADKPSYPVYYEEILRRLRPNGVVLVDNVLWDGRVLQPDADDENTRAIRAFNDMVAADARVEVVMLPIADGLTLCRKK